MTRGREMASQTRVAVVGAWRNELEDTLEEEDLDLAMRLAEGVAGGREEKEDEGSTLAAREEEARVVTILVFWFG